MLPMLRQAHHEYNPLKTLSLILSLSKDEAKISYFFSSLLGLTAFSAFWEDGNDSPSRDRPFHFAISAGLASARSASRAFYSAARSGNGGSCGPASLLSWPMSAPLHRMVRWLQQLHL
jgi:hypothetical protein